VILHILKGGSLRGVFSSAATSSLPAVNPTIQDNKKHLINAKKNQIICVSPKLSKTNYPSKIK